MELRERQGEEERCGTFREIEGAKIDVSGRSLFLGLYEGNISLRMFFSFSS